MPGTTASRCLTQRGHSSSSSARSAGNGQFNFPFDVLADNSRDRILVVDQGNSRIQSFTRNGRFQFDFGGFGEEEGQFNSCGSGAISSTVAPDSGNSVIVADSGSDRIQVFRQTDH